MAVKGTRRTLETQTLDGSDCHSGPAQADWQLPELSSARHQVYPAMVPSLGAQVLLASPWAQGHSGSPRAPRLTTSTLITEQGQPGPACWWDPRGENNTGESPQPSNMAEPFTLAVHSSLSAFCKHHSFTSATIKGHFTNICASPPLTAPPGQDSSCRHIRTTPQTGDLCQQFGRSKGKQIHSDAWAQPCSHRTLGGCHPPWTGIRLSSGISPAHRPSRAGVSSILQAGT